jgi:TPR repeat protein
MKLRALFVAMAVLLVASGCAGYRTKLATEAQREGHFERSFNLWRSLARQGNGAAQYQVGLHYHVGQGVQRNESIAARWFRKATANGVTDARDKLVQMYIIGRGHPEEDPDAERSLRESLEDGLADSKYKLALMYLDGVVVGQDQEEGLRWLRKAADSWTLHNRGIDDQLSDDGRLMMTAELGLPEAQLGLGQRYISGDGRPRNLAEGVKWHFYAAEQGHPEAQMALGWIYGKGEGVPKDFDEAIRWFVKAAEQGLPEGQYQVGSAYRRGVGMPQDNVLAHMWFNVAAGQGLRKARSKRRETGMDMTPDELARAEAMALERWLAAENE